jgi:membrane protein required for beta-lactamase induction
MLIYGNTPRDIMNMMWRRRYKFISVIAVMVIALMLMGCSIGNRKVSPPLQALDKFWDTLGSGKDKTKQDSTGVE